MRHGKLVPVSQGMHGVPGEASSGAGHHGLSTWPRLATKAGLRLDPDLAGYVQHAECGSGLFSGLRWPEWVRHGGAAIALRRAGTKVFGCLRWKGQGPARVLTSL